jgi:TolB-like protein
VAGLVAWVAYVGAGPELLGLGAVPKAVDVATLAAPARLKGRPSVAVLPFKNLSAGAGQDFFSDGITEDVITALGRFSNLLVIAKSASFPFKDSNAAPAEIGRLLDARYLLEGSVRRAGERMRVNAELTEAATGVHVWSETYDAESNDIFSVQDDIARRVVGAAAVKLTRFERERVVTKPTNSLAAYELVLRGREFLSHATREQNDEAQDMFQRAIDLDPNYAAAYAALGGAHFEMVVTGWTEFRQEELDQAERLAQKALALDPATTNAYRLLAFVNMYKRRYDLALGQIDRALEINPSDVDGYHTRGNILVWAGRATEALPWLEAALRLDRGHVLATQSLCWAYYFVGRYNEALGAGDRALARSPGRNGQTYTHPFLAASYAQLGRNQDAEGERVIVMRLWPFFDARTFAGQFGTQEARDHLLDGLKKAGFR